MKTTTFLALVGALVGLSGPSLAAQAPCQPGWLPTFGTQPGMDWWVNAVAQYDDGSGPALYAGGTFSTAGSSAANLIARWDGTSWSALGNSLSGPPGANVVRALAVFDDGSGPALYAGGAFTTAGSVAASHIAKWDGTTWSAVGGGFDHYVYALTVFDDGSGPALYAAGQFANAGGVPAARVAKWDGTSWSALGNGTNGYVAALAVFDDGSGPALYAGGGFNLAGSVQANDIAKWNGSAWSALGNGVNGNSVASLAVFDDGSGAALYVGGTFPTAGGMPASHIAKWNGSAWSALGSGTNSTVSTLAVFDDGTGPALYAGGQFWMAGGAPALRLARWSGGSWSEVGGGTSGSSVNALGVFDDGSGEVLCVGGGFAQAGGVTVNYVASWDGAAWRAFGGATGLSHEVSALVLHDDGSGPALYAGGSFVTAGGLPAKHVARWDGTSWSPLGFGLDSRVLCLAVYDDGGGPKLYAGGWFVLSDIQVVMHIACWDGVSWTPLGSGMTGAETAFVYALTVFDDGSGPKLYAGGDFTLAGGVPAAGIASWDGTSWAPLGSGADSAVFALAVHDDGSGPALFAGGSFANMGGAPAERIARWNGSTWSPLGSGIGSGPSAAVNVLSVFDLGAGPALCAGGKFSSAGGLSALNIASWDGASWSAFASGMSGGSSMRVQSLAVHDDGSGPALYAGGGFTDAGGTPANHIARWDGLSWSALANGLSNSEVRALLEFDDGDGRALYVGGSFAGSIDSGDAHLAKWGNAPGCGAPGSSFCDPGAAGVLACPCVNPPNAPGRGCNNSSVTGGARLDATGIARLSYDTVVFFTRDERPTATSIVLQGHSVVAGGAVFGQGVRCLAGNLKRLYVKTAVAGSITAPEASDLDVHLRSEALGDSIAAGTQRYYGVYYRDPVVLGGCPSASTYNLTQQLAVLWAP